MTSLYEGVVRLLRFAQGGMDLIHGYILRDKCRENARVEVLTDLIWVFGMQEPLLVVVVKAQTGFVRKLVNYVVVIIRLKKTETLSPYFGFWI